MKRGLGLKLLRESVLAPRNHVQFSKVPGKEPLLRNHFMVTESSGWCNFSSVTRLPVTPDLLR